MYSIRSIILCWVLFAAQGLVAQNTLISRVEPMFWWVGMQNPEVELLVYGQKVANYKLSLLNYAGVTLKKVETTENPNYLFVTLNIAPTSAAGRVRLKFTDPSRPIEHIYEYELKTRDNRKKAQGISSADFMYLLMPDRFANGDYSNDKVEGMKQGVMRDSLYGRHGGDLKGVIDHLDYLQNLGVTAIWMNPEIENNQPKESYHGYAATDLYKIDPRLGTNALYKEYVEACHKREMKVVKDVVFNHIGNEHWLYKDLPAKNWVHQFQEFTRTSYRSSTLLDPYAASADKKIMTDGWFDKHMPDLNQQEPHLAKYLIQNGIWWVEYSGLDCYRIDTYPYPDLDFMKNWVECLQKEYPNLGLFGETWVDEVAVQAYFVKNKMNLGYNSPLPAVTDFQLYFASEKALNENPGWMDGVMKWYYVLAQDFIYQDANKNVTFLDNHDVSRCFAILQNDVDKMKMAWTFMLTTRGIPCMYYGTEVLMGNYWDWGNHDKVRQEFPGGWKDNPSNKFTEAGRDAKENDFFNYLRTLATWRKNHEVLYNGKLMQFLPQDGVYVYFRYNDKETVMTIINSNAKEMQLDTQRFAERMARFSSATNVITGENISDIKSMTLPAKTAWVLELK
ncbi:MAG: glycoside hydrolase family 13 protein [Bacteroidia bacterium]